MSRYQFSITGFIVGIIAKLVYLSALTVLIPFGAMILTQKPSGLPATLQFFPISALALLGFSVLILLFHHRSLAHTLASLGWMTLLPGLGALGLMIFNREAVFTILGNFLGFGRIEPYIADYINSALPNVWFVTVVYIILGVVLIYIAGRMESTHTITAYVRRVFGPRARIYR